MVNKDQQFNAKLKLVDMFYNCGFKFLQILATMSGVKKGEHVT